MNSHDLSMEIDLTLQLIDALLWAEPEPEPIVYDWDLEAGTGMTQVEEATREQREAGLTGAEPGTLKEPRVRLD